MLSTTENKQLFIDVIAGENEKEGEEGVDDGFIRQRSKEEKTEREREGCVIGRVGLCVSNLGFFLPFPRETEKAISHVTI